MTQELLPRVKMSEKEANKTREYLKRYITTTGSSFQREIGKVITMTDYDPGKAVDLLENIRHAMVYMNAVEQNLPKKALHKIHKRERTLSRKQARKAKHDFRDAIIRDYHLVLTEGE